MPCSDPQAAEDNRRAHRELKQRDAMLCAILTTLRDMTVNDTFEDMVLQSEIDGECPGILQWWKEHQTIDRERLARATEEFLSNFSEHEREAVTDLLKGQ